MAENRRFSSRQRVALFLTGEGRCSECGVELVAGWHADHVIPWSRGGATDVANGQALCALCNLRKGSRMGTLRDWQKKALDAFLHHKEVDFLEVATPGAGKTFLALTAAAAEAKAFLVVVVPTVQLRFQWAIAAHGHGLKLQPTFENGHGRPPRDYDGVVVTYQAVASEPELYRKLVALMPTFVILDEVHHCADSRTWGDAIRRAFEPAHRRLLLSGTPFRGDNHSIPFVQYEGDPATSVADHRYSYSMALRDSVVRSVEFPCFDATAQWPSAGAVIAKALKEVDGAEEGRALRSALMVESDWMTAVLNEANVRLTAIRRDVPDAGGLVIADNQEHARQVGRRLQSITGASVPVAISDDPEARSVIDGFKASSTPWLVAVNMVSEGVDIRRLIVGVYATSARTELFFRQAVGRFVRTRGDESDSHPATIFIPSVTTLLKLARTIELERDHVIGEAREETGEETGEGGESGQQTLFDVMAAIDGRHDESIHNGDSTSPAELQEAERIMALAGITNLTPILAAKMLRLSHAGGSAPTEPVTTPPSQPYYLQCDQVRQALNTRVKRFCARTRTAHKDVWVRLNSAVGEWKITDATLDSLLERHKVMDKLEADENA